MNALLEETVQELGFKTLEDFLTAKLIEELEKKIKKNRIAMREENSDHLNRHVFPVPRRSIQ